MLISNIFYSTILCLIYFSRTINLVESAHILDAVEARKQQQQPQIGDIQRLRRESYDKIEISQKLFINDDVDDVAADINTGNSFERRTQTKKRSRREVTDWLIAPNTRWCGRGNSANGTYNHLGGASSADKCCRKHDHCKLFIPAMSNRYELFNYRPYTLSHCTCDRRFRTCLKMSNDQDAKTIGKLFFNMVQTQCFVLKTDRLCLERSDEIDEDGERVCISEKVRHKAYLKNNKKF